MKLIFLLLISISAYAQEDCFNGNICIGDEVYDLSEATENIDRIGIVEVVYAGAYVQYKGVMRDKVHIRKRNELVRRVSTYCEREQCPAKEVWDQLNNISGNLTHRYENGYLRYTYFDEDINREIPVVAHKKYLFLKRSSSCMLASTTRIKYCIGDIVFDKAKALVGKISGVYNRQFLSYEVIGQNGDIGDDFDDLLGKTRGNVYSQLEKKLSNIIALW